MTTIAIEIGGNKAYCIDCFFKGKAIAHGMPFCFLFHDYLPFISEKTPQRLDECIDAERRAACVD